MTIGLKAVEVNYSEVRLQKLKESFLFLTGFLKGIDTIRVVEV